MKPEIEAQTLNAFVDGELDVLGQREIEERIAHDAGLRGEAEALCQLRRQLRDLADYHVAPEEFRQRIAALVAAPPKLPARLPVGKATRPHWLNWQLWAAPFAALAFVVLIPNLTHWRPGVDDRLGQEVIASHVRSTLGEHLVDVASSDHHTVKPWLSSKLDFSPPVRETLLVGSVLLGGRVDYLDGRPVAALVYRQGRHIVNSFVWPTESADAAAVFSTEKGFQIAHWSRTGMNHWVISDLNHDEFVAIVRALDSGGSER